MLIQQLTDYINAAFSGLWIQSFEPDEAEREIVSHARQQNWKVAVWDVAIGLRLPNSTSNNRPDTGAGDPLAALRALRAEHLSPPPGEDSFASEDTLPPD